jgi:hypothetical protein
MRKLNTLQIVFLVLFISFPSYGQDYLNPKNMMELNSTADDFAPVWNIFEQRLYFNSTRDGSSMFYTSSPTPEFAFYEFSLLKGPLNNSKTNQSYITFINNRLALLSGYSLKQERSYINITKTRYERNTWTKALVDENLSVESFCGFPNASPDGKLLVFSSNQNTQNNDLDLWFAYTDDKENWSKPVQLLELNTPGNEIAPFLIASDTLVFASDGMEGPGKYDLYFSVKRLGSWSTPVPIIGLNTEFNEIGFTRLPGGLFIFSSDRPGGKGGMDLYVCNSSNPDDEIKPEVDELQLNITTQTTIIRMLAEKQTILALPPKTSVDKSLLDTNYFYDKFLYYSSERKPNLSEIEVGAAVVIKPKKLEVELDAGPAEMLDSWSAFLLTSKQSKQIATGEKMPYSKMIDINEMLISPMDDDSLIVLLVAKSKSAGKYEERFVMNVNKSTSTGLKTYNDTDGNYREILLPTDEIIADNYLSEIADITNGSQKIIIEYYSDDVKQQAMILKKSLENKLKRKLIVIKSVKYSPKNNFSAGIARQMLKVKLIID